MSETNKFTALFHSIILLLITVCTFIVTAKFDANSSLFLLLIVCLVYIAYKKLLQTHILTHSKIIGGVYTIFFSQAIAAGKQVHYVDMRNKFYDNYISFNMSCIISGLALAVLLYPFILLLIKKIEQTELPMTTITSPKDIRNYFFLAWVLIFIAWLPYLLTYYPGGIVGDGAHALEVAMQKGIPSHDHWVVLHILVLRFFLWLGSLFTSNQNVGVFLFALTECILFSGVCAAVTAKLKKKCLPKFLVWASVAMYALSGFFASYSMVLWKDSLFSAAIVLIVLQMWDMDGTQRTTPLQYIKFGFLCLFLCFWRNNGFYVLIFCILGFILFLRKQGRRFVMIGLGICVTTLVIRGPVYDSLGIGKDSLTESFSIPIQQLAATINNGVELSAHQQEILFSVIPKEKWITNYCPTLSDDLKNSINTDYFEDHVPDFLLVWGQLLIPNISIYVRAYLMQTLGFWQPNVFIGYYYDYFVGIQDIFYHGWQDRDLFEAITGTSIKNFLDMRMEFIPSGTMVWIMLFSLTAVLSQKTNRRKRLMVLTPLIASWGIIMLATPIAYAYRYIVMLPIAFPIICIIPFMHKSTK